MTDLVACLTDEKGASHVLSLVEKNNWESVFLITNDSSKSFKCSRKVDIIEVDFSMPVLEVISKIKDNLNGRIKGFEVALNIVSGNGKEHMAILSALLKLGVGIRLMAVTKEGIKEL